MDDFQKAIKLIDSMIKLEDEYLAEGNNAAAELINVARRSINTLVTKDAAKLYDLIRG